MLQLVEEEKLALKDPVSKYLPTLGERTGLDTDAITIEHLLSHQAGFDGNHLLVLRSNRLEDLVGARRLFEPGISYAQRGRGERKRPSSGWASLTPVELQVVELVAEGLRNVQPAERLFISRHTVESHLKHIFAKIGVSSRTELAREANKRGRDRI